MLAAAADIGYQRIPDRGLAWILRWEPNSWVVVDLPEEVDVPRLQAGSAPTLGEVPEPVLSAAAATGTVIGGGLVGDLWRVVVAVGDEWGGAWPVVAWFSPDGRPVAPTTTAFG
jgi:hypothetical protein